MQQNRSIKTEMQKIKLKIGEVNKVEAADYAGKWESQLNTLLYTATI